MAILAGSASVISYRLTVGGRLSLRERHLSHRLLDTYDAIVEALCRAWNALTAERIRSLTSYPYLEQVKV